MINDKKFLSHLLYGIMFGAGLALMIVGFFRFYHYEFSDDIVIDLSLGFFMSLIAVYLYKREKEKENE